MHSPITYAGIDWASRSHAVCVIDADGSAIERFEIEHTAAGLQVLTRRLTARQVVGVAIERPDGPLVDALLEAELRVVVIASRGVKALRTRYGSAGNKDDRADAYVLADVLRTDGHRLRPLRPDSPETVALRALVRARKDLVRTRLVAAPAGISGPGTGPVAAVTLGYVRAIAAVREQATLLEARIGEQLASHPDGHIFTSLPRSGTVRAAALLAEIGDCRARFPTVGSLACLEGAAPSTRQSGQHRMVGRELAG